jgi:hypothetical protein
VWRRMGMLCDMNMHETRRGLAHGDPSALK